MASKTSIIIKSIGQDNKATSRSVTDVSNTATPIQLKNFAQALNNTSTNTYTSSSRVQTTDLDDAEEKLPRNISIGTYASGDFETIQPMLNNSIEEFGVRYQGSSDPCYIQFQRPQQGFAQPFKMDTFEADDEDPLYIAFQGSIPFGTETTPWTMQVYVPESSTHLAETLTITIQGGNS